MLKTAIDGEQSGFNLPPTPCYYTKLLLDTRPPQNHKSLIKKQNSFIY